MVGKKLHLGRIVPGILVVTMGSALMTIINIHHRKERLSRSPLFPAVWRPLTFAHIPRVIVITATNVVVRLARIRRMITRLF